MKSNPSVIIIGAGMAGLSAGCYAQMNGLNSRIFEKNHCAGGVCQSWERQGYTINGCIHWLVGSGENSSFYPIWKELGVAPDLRFFNHDRYAFVEHPAASVHLYTDMDRLEDHLLQIAPEDEQIIRELIKSIRILAKNDMPMPDDSGGLAALLKNVRLLLTSFPVIRETMRWWRVTIADFAGELKNPALRAIFNDFWHPKMSMVAFVMTMAFLNRQNAGYPIGGSSRFIHQIEQRYHNLGGQIQFNVGVEEILVKDGRAYGVRLEDGAVYEADYIISAADGYATIFEMLKGNFVSDEIWKYYEEMETFPALLFASFGVNDPMADIPPSVGGIEFWLPEPIDVGNRTTDRIGVQVYNFDPTLATEGKTTLTIMMNADYDFWMDLFHDKEIYQRAKDKVLDALTGALIYRFPHLAGKIEMRDLSTPVTFFNYTGNYRGSYEGWLPTPKALRTSMKKTLPGLERFFMIGHWVEPGGGLPPAAMSGRNVIKAICEESRLKFKAIRKEGVEM